MTKIKPVIYDEEVFNFKPMQRQKGTAKEYNVLKWPEDAQERVNLMEKNLKSYKSFNIKEAGTILLAIDERLKCIGFRKYNGELVKLAKALRMIPRLKIQFVPKSKYFRNTFFMKFDFYNGGSRLFEDWFKYIPSFNDKDRDDPTKVSIGRLVFIMNELRHPVLFITSDNTDLIRCINMNKNYLEVFNKISARVG